MKIHIVNPPPPSPPTITLKDLSPGRVFYRKSFGGAANALANGAVYMVIYGSRTLSLTAHAVVELAMGTEVVPLDATLHVSEYPNT